MIIIRVMIREFDLSDLPTLKALIEEVTADYKGVEIDISIPPERSIG